jgi:cytochrome d ubiquinol oxidase subunit I
LDDPLLLSRLQFAFTITFHYLFPQLTMGLALLILIFKSLYLWRGGEAYNTAARFWGRLFAVSFVMGVITGIPMEFQFGTNWAKFSTQSGNIIAQLLAMEGAFAFFLESATLGIFLFGEKLVGRRGHWSASLLLFLGTWASAGFIIATNAWMQHPVGYRVLPGGRLDLTDWWALVTNPWAVPEYLHAISGSVLTASFTVAALGAFYLLARTHVAYGKLFVTVGVIAGLLASVVQLFPSGDLSGQQVTQSQPATLAAMEGLFQTESGAGIVLIGQPNVARQRLDNPLVVPRVLSFLTYRSWSARVKGLTAFPRNTWPDSISLLYYAYHIMVGLGTIFIAIMVLAALLLWRRRLFTWRPALWILTLALPFPYIANTAGWLTAELGRQPWLAYGVLPLSNGGSPALAGGTIVFTLLGSAGLYLILGLLYFLLVLQEAARGPEATDTPLALPGAPEAAAARPGAGILG